MLRVGVLEIVMITALVSGQGSAHAETLTAVLAKAYLNNPQLNAQRAFVRQTEEQVNIATAGYRPRIEVTGNVGPQYTDSKFRHSDFHKREQVTAGSIGVLGTQTLFDGFRTTNNVRAAGGKAQAAHEVLRMMSQQILLDAATAYMNVIRDTAVVQLQRHYVEMLQEQLKHARQRLKLREVTKTDVSQAETRLAGGRWARSAAEAALNASRATYRRVIGEEQNDTLTPATTVDRLSPQAVQEAIAVALNENPQILAAQLGIDIAAIQVKIAEGALYPTAKLEAGVQQNWSMNTPMERQFQAGAFVTLSVPIYQGGAEYATIRESKENVGQKKFDLDRTRDLVRAAVVEAWGQLTAARTQIEAAQAQVGAAESALNGVEQEARAGQRTTLDVLNAQQEVVNARITLVSTQRDRVVASYSLLAAIGRLEPEILQLSAAVYDQKQPKRAAGTK
jgi:outer membrane protein